MTVILDRLQHLTRELLIIDHNYILKVSEYLHYVILFLLYNTLFPRVVMSNCDDII